MGVWKGRVFALTLIGILLLQVTGTQITAPVYGTHQTQNIVWHIVVVSHEPSCTIYNYQLAQKYQIITEEYFKLYQIDANHYKPDCYPIEKFDWKYQKPDDVDLLIVIYDRDLGREKLHPFGMGGFYSHLGGDLTNNHTIIFCECSSFNYSDPPWILSHELSHFILNYLGFDLDKAEDQIHALDYKYDYCMEERYDETCKSIIAYIEHGDLGHKVKVMKPYQLAVGGDPFEQNLDDLDLNSKGLELFQEITKWWHYGKITDSQYSDSLQIVTGQQFNNISSGEKIDDSPTVILAEPSKEEKVNSESKLEGSSANDVLTSFQFIETDNTNLELSGNYPDWFKTRAQLWSSGKISDGGFVKSVESLQKSFVGKEDIPSLSDEDLMGAIKSFVDNGEYEKALGFIDDALENNKDLPSLQAGLFLQKGTISYLLEQYPDALRFFDAALKIEPGNVDALENKGKTLVQMGEGEQAQDYFELANLLIKSKIGRS